MAHKILVMSPLHHLGASVISAFIAQTVTFGNKTSTLLFNEPDSLLPRFLGIESVNDPTRSVMQIVKLIDSNAINDRDLLDYCYIVSKNFNLLNLTDRSLTDRDRQQVVQHVYNRVPTDIVICDNSEGLNDESSKVLIEESDTIFLIIDMSQQAAIALKEWLTDPILEKEKDKVFVIVNSYNEVVSSVRDFAKYLGLPASRVAKLHYNPWINKCCNNGGLHTILPLSKEFDPRVANLKNDIDELKTCIDYELIKQLRKVN